MARCGCESQECHCVVDGSTNIVRTGIGSVSIPYVISGQQIQGLAEVRANQGPIIAETLLVGLTVPIVAGTNRYIKITAQILLSGTVDGDQVRLRIKEGGTVLQVGDTTLGSPLRGDTIITQVVLTPNAGPHIYDLTLQLQNGSGSVTLFAAADSPSFNLVEDIGGY